MSLDISRVDLSHSKVQLYFDKDERDTENVSESEEYYVSLQAITHEANGP